MQTEKPLSLLYIEDNLADLILLQSKLKRSADHRQISIEHVVSLQDASVFLRKKPLNTPTDLVLLDLSLPDAQGLEGVRFMLEKFPSLPLVVLTGNIDKSTGVRAIKEGAQDYLVKGDFTLEMLVKVCNYAIERTKINQQLKEALLKVNDLNDELTQVNTRLQDTVDALRIEKERVEEKNQQIHSLVTILMHDLKNPISTISSITNLLLEKTSQMTVPQIKFINQIKNSSSVILDHILTLVDTLNVKKGDALHLTLTQDNPFYTLNSAVDKFVIESIQKNIILDIRYSKSLPHVFFDRRALEKVVSELMEFLIREAEESSRIMIECQVEEGETKIIVENPKFKKAEELKNALQNANKGTSAPSEGLNFPLILQLVKAMRGKLGVDATPRGNGTRMWFTLQNSLHAFHPN